MKLFSTDKKEKYRLVPLKPCSCGYLGISSSRFDDVVHCENCGIVHYIGPGVTNRIAQWEAYNE
jgi:hypothetical protein